MKKITENEIKNVNGSLSKTNLVLIYNEMCNFQKDLGLNRLEFDDNNTWGYYDFPKRVKDILVRGDKKYGCLLTFNIEEDKWKIFIAYIRESYKGIYSFAKELYTIKKYIHILLDKLVPNEEYAIELRQLKE